MAKEIKIYGTIGYDWWTDGGITANWFARQMDEAEASDDPDIDIRINSPGGSVFDGIAIYNRIAQSKKNITTYNDGIAYSMGGIILLAGNTIKAANNSTILIHNVSGGAWGNAQDLRGALEMMEALDESLATTIAAKTGLSVEGVQAKWLDFQDHTLTARKALDEKLIDEVLDYKAENVPANLHKMSKEEVLAWFKDQDAPKNQGWFEKLVGKVREAMPTNKVTQQLTDMKMKFLAQWAALAVVLGFSFAEGEAEKEVELTNDHLEKMNAELVKLQAEKAKADDLQAKLEKAEQERDEWKGKFEAKAADKPKAGGDAGDPPPPEQDEEDEVVNPQASHNQLMNKA